MRSQEDRVRREERSKKKEEEEEKEKEERRKKKEERRKKKRRKRRKKKEERRKKKEEEEEKEKEERRKKKEEEEEKEKVFLITLLSGVHLIFAKILFSYIFPIPYSLLPVAFRSYCLKAINFWLYSCIEMHPLSGHDITGNFPEVTKKQMQLL
ncbi:MAG: hypothetical protein F6K18_24970 [Okeania sp. SIO2C2]|uniref:hypothetical protein n=1 Tax=Okeania sp. SIO2C2 TaxID=2607787 RepID=UPI0013B7CBA9|nr:hypothetical protein [Okeania sp. SIO2C2]NEP89816.1 hypothetical protein [Okeania sp. SIO2C2]